MSSVKRPRMPKPKIPKIKKPTISKTKRLRKKLPTLSVKQTNSNTNPRNKSTTHKPTHKKKNSTQKRLGTCYLQAGCKSILAKGISRAQCKNRGGKSWKTSGGTCECLAK